MKPLATMAEEAAQSLGLGVAPLLMLVVFLALVLVLLAAALIWSVKSTKAQHHQLFIEVKEQYRKDLTKGLLQSNERLLGQIGPHFLATQAELTKATESSLSALRQETFAQLSAFSTHVAQTIERAEQQVLSASRAEESRGHALGVQLNESLTQIRGELNSNLEKMRLTVEEKLQKTLESRLSESFGLVSGQLGEVYRGLGEMRQLASDVGSLKRVLVNVRSRGLFGEIQLEALLSDSLAASQYVKDAHTVPDQPKLVVEFAVRLPGLGGQTCLLPIDSKFPIEDFQRVQASHERGDRVALVQAKEALRKRLISDAASIARYIHTPQTTDFAVMFVPSEALYAEALSIAGLAEALYGRYRVCLMGPSTLMSAIGAYRAGFQSLAIQKRSAEIQKTLGRVKTEFQKFEEVLEALRRQLQAAGNTVERAETRTRQMRRQLSDAETDEMPVLAD